MMHFIKSGTHELEKNMEVIAGMENMAEKAVAEVLVDPNECWQPSDFLPDFHQPDVFEQVAELQKRAKGIPDEVIMSLVGNMITEEALPSYQTYFNLTRGINEEGNLASEKGWARWSRAWTAEENRHGDLLNKYLFLSGRVDMKAVETTIHNLLYNGFDPQTEQDPYQTMIYTSFQERATKIAHVNTGKLAHKGGDESLSRICKTIAGDEARHEKAYKTFMLQIFETDPSGAVLAFDKMMRKQITMPAVLMDQSKEDNLFTRFSAITQKMGIYTTLDYASIIDHLNSFWKVSTLSGLTGDAARAQDYLSTLADRYRRIAERMKDPGEIKLAWIVS